jgi:C4-dicarboxylate-specific signal transduction histidine kinase
MTVEANTQLEALQQLSKALHDLCQPMTTLQCRLEMAGVMGTADAYREAVELGLTECSRLIEAVDAMRGMIRAAMRSSGS